MSEVKTNKISPATGTAFTLGDSGDNFSVPSGGTLTIASGATITNSGTASGLGGGKVLQIQTALTSAYTSTTASMPFDDTIVQNDEGAELVTLAFTPSSTGSKLLFIYGGLFNMGAGGNHAAPIPVALFVDTTADCITSGVILTDGGGTRVSGSWLFHLETNSSTAERTYKMRWAVTTGTAYVNGDTSTRKFGGRLASGFYVIEFEN